jgi:DNA polymerase elongation subunit (family B)
MDAVELPPPFDTGDGYEPVSDVVKGAYCSAAMSRDQLCEPPPPAADGSVTFALFTVDVRHDLPQNVGADVTDEGVTCVEGELMRINRATRAARHAEEQEWASAHAHEFARRMPAPPISVVLTGQLVGGRKVGFVVRGFEPHCFVEAPHSVTTREAADALFAAVRKQLSFRMRDVAVTLTPLTAAHFGRFEPLLRGEFAGRRRREFYFARLSTPNADALRRVARLLRAGLEATRFGGGVPPLEIHEDNIDLDQKFVDAAGLLPCGWHTVERARAVPATPTVRQLLTSEEYVLNATTRGAPSPFRVSIGATHVPAETRMPTLHIASLDCEMNPHIPARFPAARRPTDAVVVIGIVFAFAGVVPASLVVAGVREYGEYERHAFVLSSRCDPIPGVIVHLFDDEGEMLAAVRDELFVRKQIDVLLGHNLANFDVKYMAERAARSGNPAARRFLRFGSLLLESLRLKEKKLSSSGMGSNTLTTLPGAGFVYVDTMLFAKATFKLRDYSLSTVAASFLPAGVSKFDMPYELIPEAVRGDGTQWAKLTAYCVQDCRLPLMLAAKWQLLQDLVAQSRIICIPMAVNVGCGQQVRVRNTVMRKAHGAPFYMVCSGIDEPKDVVRARKDALKDARKEARRHARAARKRARDDGDGDPDGDPDVAVNDENVDIHDDDDSEDDEGDGDDDDDVVAEGGAVFDTVPGVHYTPVVVLDFASLYPTVQQACQFSYDTHLAGDVTDERVDALRAAGYTVDVYRTTTGNYGFVSNVDGVFPRVLADLREQRTQYKRAMETAAAAKAAALAAGDAAGASAAAAAYANADASQKSTKIVMNSGYGTANCMHGKMPCRAFGTATCYVGSRLNRLVASFVCGALGSFPVPNEDLRAKGIALKMLDAPCLGARLLYGDTDSIMVQVPLPPELSDACPREKLRFAFQWGNDVARRINELIDFGLFKTEFEKVYYPFCLSNAKKQYAGVKYEPHQNVDAMHELLLRPDRAVGRDGGRIETKGMKAVRRDAPAFVKRMTLTLFEALLYDANEDAFWDVVHRYTEDVAAGRLPLDDFVVTAELKDNYPLQAAVTPQAAVSYAKEHAVPGSAFVEGVRVPFVHVEEPDERRLAVPRALLEQARANVERSRDNDLERVFDAIQRELGVDEPPAYAGSQRNASAGAGSGAVPATAPTARKSSGSGGGVKLAAFARHPKEVEAHPEHNHVDYLRYHMLGIDAVLKQIMPQHVEERKRLAQYAEAAAQIRRTMRARAAPRSGLLALMGTAGGAADAAAPLDAVAASAALEDALARRLPKLTHRTPVIKRVQQPTLLKFVTVETTPAGAAVFAAAMTGSAAAPAAAAVSLLPPPRKLTAAQQRVAKAKTKKAVSAAAGKCKTSTLDRFIMPSAE